MSLRRPTVLMVHNYYRSASPSGENCSVDDEVALLRSAGHMVHTYSRSNDEIQADSLLHNFSLARQTVWAPRSYRDLNRLLTTHSIDLVHVQNTFPLISPSVLAACREARVPVIASLRNFRLLCPAANFYRKGTPCEDCVGRLTQWPGILHRCYRRSFARSSVIALANFLHGRIQTWLRNVSLFIAPSEFVRHKFLAAGFPPEKLRVKPNFVLPDPGARRGPGNFAVFIGRLSADKGIEPLLDAWQKLPYIPLRLIGDGPLSSYVRSRLESPALRHVSLLGPLLRPAVMDFLADARFVVVPSVVYETFGRAAVESFARGVPVLASNLGALPEIVTHNRTGLLFAPSSPADLAEKASWAWVHSADLAFMGRAARLAFEANYTAAQNYRLLMQIYSEALGKPNHALWTASA